MSTAQIKAKSLAHLLKQASLAMVLANKSKMSTAQTVHTVQTAITAAKAAEAKFRAHNGEPMFCGFSWVEVLVERTNSKEAKELLAAGFRKDYKPKCLSLWNPGGSSTQSMLVKEAGADAFAAVLRAAGFDAYAQSRAD